MRRLPYAVMPLSATHVFGQSWGDIGDITVQSLWSRATPPGAKSGAVYFDLRNGGATDERLIGATTPAASKAALHTEIMENGVRDSARSEQSMSRRESLKPGGSHIMLMGSKRPLKQREHVPLALKFAHAPPLRVQVEVAKIGASEPDASGHSDMKDMH
jgi:periplasmic copper chaperone A